MLLRAFPGTLGLDVETSIRPAVLFIRVCTTTHTARPLPRACTRPLTLGP